VDVCEFVDELDPDEVGELVVECRPSKDPCGKVFVEGRRVCWAAARGLARRLTELLVARAGLDATQLESTYAACKETRTPLGEYLVRKGMVEAGELRAALREHTIESLVHVCHQGEVRAGWIPRRTGGYSPRFTFSTSELLPLAFAASHREIAAEADPELRAIFASGASSAGEWGAAFVRTPARASPDPVAAHGTLPSTSAALLRVGKWASSALDVVSTFQDPDAIVSAMDGESMLVAWRHGGAIIAGRMEPRGPARILNRRARLRRDRGRPDGDL